MINLDGITEKSMALACATVGDLSLTSVPRFTADNGSLVVLEAITTVPFNIVRVFVVTANADQQRGHHAHKECRQFLVCTSGRVEVVCDDGYKRRTFMLDSADKGLFVPPGIWAEQVYKLDNSVLTVLCDKPYDEDDYLREYADFKTYRGIK